MSQLEGFVQQENPSRGSDGSAVGLRATRDGSLYSIDWYTALTLEGKVFGANSGTLSGAITYEEAYAAAEQDLFLHVPSSVVVIPIAIRFAVEDTAGAQSVFDCMAAVSSTGDSAVTGTALTIRNMRTDLAGTLSACTATAVVTSNGSDVSGGNYYEFWRPEAGAFADTFNANTAPVSPLTWNWSVADSTVPPIVAGGGSVSAWFAATAALIGFSSLSWAELPEDAV